MSYTRICKSHILKIVSLLSVRSSLKWTGKKDSGMDFNKHKCVFFPEVAWFLEMSYVESKKRRGFHLNTPKITVLCNYIKCYKFNSITHLNYISIHTADCLCVTFIFFTDCRCRYFKNVNGFYFSCRKLDGFKFCKEK